MILGHGKTIWSKNIRILARLYLLTVVMLRNGVLWEAPLCCWVNGSWHFERQQCLHLRDRTGQEEFFMACRNWRWRQFNHLKNQEPTIQQQHHIPEYLNLQQQCCEKIQSHIIRSCHTFPILHSTKYYDSSNVLPNTMSQLPWTFMDAVVTACP